MPIEIEPLSRLNLTITKELMEAIDVARRTKGRSEFIEEVLRKCQPIKKAKEQLGIEFLPRRRSGVHHIID